MTRTSDTRRDRARRVSDFTILIPCRRAPAARAGSSGAATTPGTNSAGTAQSSGANTAPGVTTGSAGSLGTGTAPTPTTDSDTAINAENKTIDRKLNSICKGC